jgi:DNA polymerase
MEQRLVADAFDAPAATPGDDHHPRGRFEHDRTEPDDLQQCRRCALWARGTQAVGGEGAGSASLMLVGEQPGDEEDLAGRPFVGPAGRLLDRALAVAGIERHSVYVTNAVKHFKWEPRGRRRIHKTPTQREIDACHYWLERELESVRPRVIVALGASAARSVLGGPATISAVRGRGFRHGAYTIVVTYHPSAVLRVPERARRDALFALLVEDLSVALACTRASAPSG